MDEKGDIKLNGYDYRVEDYRMRDIVDFSPRASTPGGSILHSELMLYQPLMQSDWRHGFGFHWYSDAMGYMITEGNVDTRMDGIAMMFTQKVLTDADGGRKDVMVIHNKQLYAAGSDGVKRLDNTAMTWADITPSTTPKINTLFSSGDYLFAAPNKARLRKSQYSGKIKLTHDELSGEDCYISEVATTTKYSKSSLIVGTTAAGKHRSAWLRFDMAKIPAGATITGATLDINTLVKTASVPALAITRLITTSPDEANMTWAKKNATTNWATAGGRGSGTDISATNMYAGSAVNALGHTILTLDATEVGLMFASNQGLMIWENDTANKSLTISSFWDSEGSRRPVLEVSFTLATDWSDAGATVDSTDYSWFLMHNGAVYAGKRDTNFVHYATASDLSDLEGTSADVDRISIGLNTSSTIRAIVYATNLYVAKPDGLWQVTDDKIARRVLDFSAETSDQNFRSMCVYGGYLMFAIRDRLYMWNGARLTDTTPSRMSDVFPYRTYGRFNNFVSVGRFMYCTARTNDTTPLEDLLCWDGTSWTRLDSLSSDGLGQVTLLFYDTIRNYLWIQVDSYDSTDEYTSYQKLYYIQFQTESEYPYPNFATTGTHSIISSRLDMGFRRVIKSSPSILVEAQNVTANRKLGLYVSLDGGAYTLWGYITANGVTEVVAPSPGTVEYKYMNIKMVFITDSATQSPILEGVTLRFLMRPDVGYGWNFNILASDNIQYGEMQSMRTARNIAEELRAARDSKAPLTYYDIHGVSWKVYVSAMNETMVERHVNKQESGYPSVEQVINVNLVEAR
jgi:hypothetical protein